MTCSIRNNQKTNTKEEWAHQKKTNTCMQTESKKQIPKKYDDIRKKQIHNIKITKTRTQVEHVRNKQSHDTIRWGASRRESANLCKECKPYDVIHTITNEHTQQNTATRRKTKQQRKKPKESRGISKANKRLLSLNQELWRGTRKPQLVHLILFTNKTDSRTHPEYPSRIKHVWPQAHIILIGPQTKPFDSNHQF